MRITLWSSPIMCPVCNRLTARMATYSTDSHTLAFVKVVFDWLPTGSIKGTVTVQVGHRTCAKLLGSA